jgi:hypothetical protein
LGIDLRAKFVGKFVGLGQTFFHYRKRPFPVHYRRIHTQNTFKNLIHFLFLQPTNFGIDHFYSLVVGLPKFELLWGKVEDLMDPAWIGHKKVEANEDELGFEPSRTQMRIGRVLPHIEFLLGRVLCLKDTQSLGMIPK